MTITFYTTQDQRTTVRKLCWDQENTRAPDILTEMWKKAVERLQ